MKHLLKDIADIQIGYQTRGKVVSEPKGTHRIIQARDFQDDYSLNTPGLYSIKVQGNVENYLVKKEDILFLPRGNNNFAAVIKEDLENTLASGHFYIIRIKKNIILPGYLAWLINTSKIQAELSGKARGSNIQLIPKSIFQYLEVLIPPFVVQEKIVGLSSLMKKEQQLTRQLLEKRQILIQALCLKLSEEKGDNIL
jgi:restriction endonuclease S subunit